MLSNAQAAQRMLEKSPPDLVEVKEILSDIVREDRRASDVILKLRELMRRGETKLVMLDLNQLVSDVLSLFRADMESREVVVEKDLCENLAPVLGDRIQLQQVVMNLLRNACDAMRQQSAGLCRIQIATDNHNGRVRLTVRDHGPGIADNLETIFQPFFTTSPEGMGMGLSICRSIMQAHHGWLWAENHAQGGAAFHMELPPVMEGERS